MAGTSSPHNYHQKGRTANMMMPEYAMTQTSAHPSTMTPPPPPPAATPSSRHKMRRLYFEPCAATASLFLYAQGNSVVCCHHDSLIIERRFANHADEVQILEVDNQSEMGAGRLVVSYDASQEAIVWDVLSGHEIARFASYENLTCAAWMRNGNVAFGEFALINDVEGEKTMDTNMIENRKFSGKHHPL
jgi:hypothetical protein